ncbi:hypothetical protein [Borrelia miyamotoi]|uniref:Uncharacterized protein n=1 Tax=Borrelia miyamotoi TaxID=47466 RepID=A0AAQ2WVB1_9SPIR|nr:hypothetical protein [Borrelia miyamotoi]AJA58378.1 membrane protein [Borrelia miyamotoi]AOW95455.1 hypothetical protein AXH25_00915 [Borrelia miyamotoi]WAZ85367.1 hypothetical protein O5400_03360 [Borrelia miyamotoi]WAZ91149.1 hypothetical protein O5398_03365 [Borrelia miyamotoi]WAZ92435.1 hypothetical protein O5402_03360 [Borrelia miyamotoi]
MNIFLLVSLPLAFKIYMKIKHSHLKLIKQSYIHAMLILSAMTIFSLLYLTEEFILYKTLLINYQTKFSLASSIFIKEQIYYYVLPLFIFTFFFTFNPNSLLKKNPIFLTYFAFGLIFSKNLELIITNSKVFGTYEYIKIPLLHILELISTAIICTKGIHLNMIQSTNGYKLIFIPILILEAIITLLKVLILTNAQAYALTILIIILGISILNKKFIKTTK